MGWQDDYREYRKRSEERTAELADYVDLFRPGFAGTSRPKTQTQLDTDALRAEIQFPQGRKAQIAELERMLEVRA
jgi:hypothetical protein